MEGNSLMKFTKELMKYQHPFRVQFCSVIILTMAYQLDHKYFISLALQDKMAWDTLPFIIEGLTSTLEKSKEVNKFLLQELEKTHSKFQSLKKELSETFLEYLESKTEPSKSVEKDIYQTAVKSEPLKCKVEALEFNEDKSSDFEEKFDENTIGQGCDVRG